MHRSETPNGSGLGSADSEGGGFRESQDRQRGIEDQRALDRLLMRRLTQMRERSDDGSDAQFN